MAQVFPLWRTLHTYFLCASACTGSFQSCTWVISFQDPAFKTMYTYIVLFNHKGSAKSVARFETDGQQHM